QAEREEEKEGARVMKTKKAASKKNEAARIGTEVPAVVMDGVRVEDGRVVVAVTLPLPQPTMKENEKWPWGPWQVRYLENQAQKDLARLALTVGNLQHVRGLVEARAAAKAASKPAPAPVAVVGQAQAAAPTAGQ